MTHYLAIFAMLLLLGVGCTTPAEEPSPSEDVGGDVDDDTSQDAEETGDTPPDAPCVEGVTRWFTCPDGTRVAECMCVNGEDVCIDDAEGQCRSMGCDDGEPVSCDRDPLACGEGELLAAQDGCWVCVNPVTCRPWGEPGCQVDADCPAEKVCNFCGTSSCPGCENCLPACVEHGCPTEAEPACNAIRPECGPLELAVVRGGCWLCVSEVTCEPEAGVECEAAGGYCAHFMEDCGPLYMSGPPMDCPLGRSAQCCLPRQSLCDDGEPVICAIFPPTCETWEELAVQDGCWVCVNPATCRPWGEPGCQGDLACSPQEWCDDCATSSCPACDDCVADCRPHACLTELEPLCNSIRPECGDREFAVVLDGCWVCVSAESCEPAQGGECRAAGGYCAHFMDTCDVGFMGGPPMDCPPGRSGMCCLPRDSHCDDGEPVVCARIPPVCDEGEVLAAQGGCWACVNPVSCRPWGEPGCASDMDCSATAWCNGCATSSCPVCDDCIAACVPHGCPTETQLTCRCARPDCGQGNTSVIRDGCWVCVDARTCEDARAGSCQ